MTDLPRDRDRDGLAEQPQLRLKLLESLLNNYVYLTNADTPAFVLKKLCSTLVTFYLKPSSGWSYPVTETVLSFVRGHCHPVEQPPPTLQFFKESLSKLTFTQLRSLLWLCDTLANDAVHVDSGALRDAAIQTEVVSKTGDEILLVHRLLLEDVVAGRENIFETNLRLDHDQTEDLVVIILDQMPKWISLIESAGVQYSNDGGKSYGLSISQNIDYVFACFDNERLSDQVIQCIGALMQRSSSKMGRTHKAQLSQIVQSRKATFWVESQMRCDGVGETFVEFLDCLVDQEDLSSPDYLEGTCLPHVIPILQRLLSSDGVPNVENMTHSIVLEDLSRIVEGYADWEDRSVYADQMQIMILDVCRNCLLRAMYPPLFEMDADDRTKFRDFRNDVTDFLQSAFACVGQSVVHLISQDLLSDDAQVSFDRFEAGLFCLSAFSDTLSSDVEKYDDMINAIFVSLQWNRIMDGSGDVPDRARQGVISFLGYNTSYLQRHREQLLPCLNFLFSSLQRSGAIHASARAIHTLCQSQRKVLASAWPQFIASIRDLSHLLAADRHRLFAAVASVVQGVNSEAEKIEPLSRLLELVEDSFAAREKGSSDEVLAYAIDSMQNLAAIGRGLKALPETAIVLEGEVPREAQFWTEGAGRPVQDRALHICSYLLSSCGTDDGEMVVATCDFIRSGYSEQHPSPFKFSVQASINFYPTLLGRTSHIEAVISAASAFLASISSGELPPPHFSQLIDPMISLLRNQQDAISATFDFLTRLHPKWTATWFSLPSAPDQLRIIFESVLQALKGTDTLPRRAAAALLAAVLDIPHETIMEQVQEVIHLHLTSIVSRVFRLLAGDCARSEIEALAMPLRGLITRYPLLTRPMIRNAMNDGALDLSPQALEATTLQQRLRFVAQLEALCRSGGGNRRRLVELVREFWVLCRGAMGLGYIA